MKIIIILLTASILLFIQCSENENSADAFGNFEVDEINISSETSGKIIKFNVTEGDRIDSNFIIAQIDTTQLYLKKLQIEASIRAITAKTKDIAPQINVLLEQKNNLEREKKRFEKLVRDSATPSKYLDDLKSQIDILEKNIIASRSALSSGNAGILSEIEPLRIQLMQIEDNISRCSIKSGFNATVLNKYANTGEMAFAGRSICKIADLNEVYLKAYVSGAQLNEIKLGDKVKVRIDSSDGKFVYYPAVISYISSKSEFTPKIIQTKDERVNLVYSFKLKIKNDGKIKIGMPGEVIFR